MPEGIAGESAPFLWHHIDLCYWGRHRWSGQFQSFVEFVWNQNNLGFHVITAGCYVNDGEGIVSVSFPEGMVEDHEAHNH